MKSLRKRIERLLRERDRHPLEYVAPLDDIERAVHIKQLFVGAKGYGVDGTLDDIAVHAPAPGYKGELSTVEASGAVAVLLLKARARRSAEIASAG